MSIISLDYQDTWSLSHSPIQGESMSSCISSSEITLATKCNSGSKWPLAIQKNSVPQQGVEPWPLTNLASIITTILLKTNWLPSHYVTQWHYICFMGEQSNTSFNFVMLKTIFSFVCQKGSETHFYIPLMNCFNLWKQLIFNLFIGELLLTNECINCGSFF